MTPKVAALRAQSDDILRRFLRLDERGRRLVLRGLSKAQAAEYTTRWFGFENDGQRDPPALDGLDQGEHEGAILDLGPDRRGPDDERDER